MQSTTGAWAALSDVPWTAPDGTSYKNLGARADALLSRLEAAIDNRGLRNQTPVTLLANRVSELNAALRDLAASELAVESLIALGGKIERSRRRSMRIL